MLFKFITLYILSPADINFLQLQHYIYYLLIIKNLKYDMAISGLIIKLFLYFEFNYNKKYFKIYSYK